MGASLGPPKTDYLNHTIDRPMHTFHKTCDPANRHDTSEVIVRTEAEELSNLVNAFEDYLRACGFYFHGQRIELVDDDTNDLPQTALIDHENQSQ